MEQRLFTPLLCEQAPQLRRFEAEVHKNWMVHEKLLSFFGGFKSDAHPMAIMVSVVGALSAFYPDSVNIHDAAQRRLSAIRMAPEMSHGAPCRARTVSSRLTCCEQVAKMPTIAAIAYKTSIGEPVVYPSNALPFAGATTPLACRRRSSLAYASAWACRRAVTQMMSHSKGWAVDSVTGREGAAPRFCTVAMNSSCSHASSLITGARACFSTGRTVQSNTLLAL